MFSMIQVNRIYLIFNPVNFLVDSSEEKYENDFYDHFYVYYISRIFNGVETPIYIGITEQDFKDRLKQHFKDEKDFFKKRGVKTYRIGRIKKSRWIGQLNKTQWRNLIETIGSTCNKRIAV